MPPEENVGVDDAPLTASQTQSQGITGEAAMQVMRIFGTQNQYEPTQAQVDKLLDLQEKGVSKVKKDE